MKQIKQLLLISILMSVFLFQPAFARTIEIDVFGMTCPFCVDSLQRKFGKIDSVSKVDVSLKLKKIRLETKDDSLSIDTIKKTVLDAGFTPTKVTVLDNAKK